MKLRKLEPEFLKLQSANSFRRGISMAGTDGIWFLCPKCFQANGGPVGTHHVLCWRPHVPQSIKPGPGRWEWTGTSFDDLSLVAGSSSILLLSGCKAHFFVTNGEIVGLT